MSLFDGLNLSDNVKNFQLDVNSTMKDIRSNTLSTIDPAISKVKEGVALVTNKDTGMVAKVESYKSEVVNKLSGVVGNLSGGRLNLKDITGTIKVGKDGFFIDKKQLTGKLMDAYGLRTPDLAGFARELTSDINSEFQRLTGLNGMNLLTADGTKIRITGGWGDKMKDFAIKEISDVIGLDGVFDVSVEAALKNALFKKSVNYGMSGQYKSIYDTYGPGMESVRRDVVLELIDEVLKAGDLISLKALIDLLEREGKNAVFSRYPDFVERLFANFKFDRDLHIEDRPEMVELLKSVLNTLVGPKWFYKKTVFGEAYNLALVNRISPDMKDLLILWEEVVPLVCASGMFPVQSAKSVMFKEFEFAPKFVF